jgi:hypothetical protein
LAAGRAGQLECAVGLKAPDCDTGGACGLDAAGSAPAALEHVLGLGHLADPTSVMYATLGAGTANRNLISKQSLVRIFHDRLSPCTPFS